MKNLFTVTLFGTLLMLMSGCSTASDETDIGKADAGTTQDLTDHDLGLDATIPDDLFDAQEPGPDAADDAAAGDVDAAADLAADTTPEVTPWEPPFDPTVCGSKPHQWLPPDGMGTVVLEQEEAMSNVSPEMIDQILQEAGYEKFGAAKYPVRNFKIRYTTQDRGELTEATAVIGIPISEDAPVPAPMLLWLHGTTGFMDDCAPSKDMVMGAGATSLWAAQGYIAVAPDYMGLRGFGEPSPPGTIHSYLIGEPTAISSLDSVRAALDFLQKHPEFIAADPDRIVMIGGSQGGHAAFFTERYWPHYAPELNFVGIVAAVPPANILGQSANAMSHLIPGSANFMTALVAAKNWYGLPENLDGLLTNQEPYFAADNLEGWLSGSCHPDVDPTDVNELSDVFLEPIIEAASTGNWDDIPPWGCFLRENTLPGTSVERLSDVPYLTSYSENDELVMNDIEMEVWPVLCEQGYDMEHVVCAGKGHAQGALAIIPYAKKWLEDRVNGVPIEAENYCVINDPVDCDTLVPIE